MTTFAEARAACISRWGDPSNHDPDQPNDNPLVQVVRWDVGNHETILADIQGLCLSLCLDMCGAPEVMWTLDGMPAHGAPLKGLTEALNEADTLLGRPLPEGTPVAVGVEPC